MTARLVGLLLAVTVGSACTDPAPTAGAIVEARAEASARCDDPAERTPAELDSLRAAVRPGQRSELVTSVPAPVVATRDALLEAAKGVDFGRLRALSGGRAFQETLGPEPGPDLLDPATRGAASILPTLAAALVEPLAVRFEDIDREGAFVYVWPVYAASDGLRLSDREVACIRRLYGDDIADHADRFGSFAGPSVGIGSDGEWVSFAAGGD